jgi:hypothetical protein
MAKMAGRIATCHVWDDQSFMCIQFQCNEFISNVLQVAMTMAQWRADSDDTAQYSSPQP